MSVINLGEGIVRWVTLQGENEQSEGQGKHLLSFPTTGQARMCLLDRNLNPSTARSRSRRGGEKRNPLQEGEVDWEDLLEVRDERLWETPRWVDVGCYGGCSAGLAR